MIKSKNKQRETRNQAHRDHIKASPTASHRLSKKSIFAASLSLSIAITGLLPINSAHALTRLTADSGTRWDFHDSFAPNLDTGSVRSATSTPMQGFGNIFVQISTQPEPRMNGQMMRDFGLVYDGTDTFVSTRSVNLGDVHVTRDVYFDSTNNRTRFFDTFTNTTSSPVTVDVSFGGSLGYGTGPYHASIQQTSSGDTIINNEDSWVLVDNARPADRPIGIVLGTPGPFEGALKGTGNQQKNPFTTPMAASGNDSNFYGFIHSLSLEPNQTKSLARYVVVGDTDANKLTTAADSMNQLVLEPDFTHLTAEQVCTISNWDLTKLPGYDPSACSTVTTLPIPPAPAVPPMVTTSKYDVVNKTIAEMQADMENGVTTSAAITQAYLDRINAYDLGQLGFHSFLHVGETALEQAKAADAARANGQTGPLLGIPIAVKDIYDTKDMPTTGGSKALEGWQPGSDAYQIQKLREAGAIIIGKTNTSEFANSGSMSESGWMQTWNAINPSKTSFGSSGGSAVSIAADFAAAAMGTQTGVSLYAPSVGASLTTFRGTDGMSSTRGVMPLTWGQDYAGPIARTVTDLAILLNATTGTDPEDILTKDADRLKPEDWTKALNANSLQGKRIGYIPSSFVSSYADDGTGEAVKAHFADLIAAGATMVEMSSPPSGGSNPGGNVGSEGWARYIELHKDFPYETGDHLLASPLVLLYNQRNLQVRPRMTEAQVQAYINYRTNYKSIIANWMDQSGVDSVVYPGFISDVYNNDSAASQLSSDRATGVLTSNVGLPTVVVPVGTSPNGYSLSMQLVGKAWDDANILGMGYALEQQTKARVLTSFAPKLTYLPNDTTDPQGGTGEPGTKPTEPTEPTEPGPTEPTSPTGPTGPGPTEPSGPTGPTGPTPTPGPTGTTGSVGPTEPPKGSTGKDDAQTEKTPVTISFTDTNGHWAKESIDFLIQKGLINGYPDGSFRPNLGITRAEAVKVLTTELGLTPQTNSFTDVTASHWAAGFIGAAQHAGLMTGYTNGTFKADAPISREEMAALLVRAFKLSDGTTVSFSDIPANSWSYNYIAALTANQIITGYTDGTFRPANDITRAEFSTMVTKVLKLIK
ncbi:amidase family protein [Paenibacillus sp. NPDC058177]|uniref:amidase family protein n=1 Tax=Paenibacillus sp. NPDC058177 TaxID=3346369 RepID=UPI0036D83EBA